MTANRWGVVCEFLTLLAIVAAIFVVLGLAGAILFALVVP